MPEPEIIAFRLSPEQERVLGCLVEKSVTTPDTYPMSLNSIRLACNQSTNREPVVAYDERTVQETLDSLRNVSLVARSKAPGERAIKFRHLLPDVLELTKGEQAVLCTLLLRGPQTPGELKSRGDRMHKFAAVGEVQTALGDLGRAASHASSSVVPAERETRWMHLLGN